MAKLTVCGNYTNIKHHSLADAGMVNKVHKVETINENY